MRECSPTPAQCPGWFQPERCSWQLRALFPHLQGASPLLLLHRVCVMGCGAVHGQQSSVLGKRAFVGRLLGLVAIVRVHVVGGNRCCQLCLSCNDRNSPLSLPLWLRYCLGGWLASAKLALLLSCSPCLPCLPAFHLTIIRNEARMQNNPVGSPVHFLIDLERKHQFCCITCRVTFGFSHITRSRRQ